jgi:anthranilate phosphoribosyltransferase
MAGMSLDPLALRAAVDRPGGMSSAETRDCLALLMSGALSVEAGAGLLEAWATRGETAAELLTVVEVLLSRAVVPRQPQRCFDIVGTGGSGLTRYNVSTTSAFALAAVGVPVAKHGNKGSTRPNGAFDLLEALDIPIGLPPAAQERLLRETGVCFLFARSLHPAMAAVAPMRKRCPRRTVFNLAGPLANPWRPCRQVIGCSRTHTAEVVAAAVAHLGLERALVVVGHPGIDEISVLGPTERWHIQGGAVHKDLVDGPSHDPNDLPGGDAPENATLFLELIRGQRRGVLLDMVVANAGTAWNLWHDRSLDDPHGSVAIRQAFADGAVAHVYDAHRRLAAELAQA